jgi:hypothetical protein
MQMFPVLRGIRDHRKNVVRELDWQILETRESRAKLNHGQDLMSLALHGGLAPDEIVAIMLDRPWRSMNQDVAEMLLCQIARGKEADECLTHGPYLSADSLMLAKVLLAGLWEGCEQNVGYFEDTVARLITGQKLVDPDLCVRMLGEQLRELGGQDPKAALALWEIGQKVIKASL